MKVSAVFERLSTFEVDRVARYLKSGEKQFQIEAAKLEEEIFEANGEGPH